MWPWTCHGLSLSFCSPLLDDFENNVSFLLAALCHVCLSCKLLKMSALSGGLLSDAGVVCQLGKLTFKPAEHPWISTGLAWPGLPGSTLMHKGCVSSQFQLWTSLFVHGLGNQHISRGALRCLVGSVMLQQLPSPSIICLFCHSLFVAAQASAEDQ